MSRLVNIKTVLVLLLVAVIIIAANFFIGQEREKQRRITLEKILNLTVSDVDKKIAESIKQETKEKESALLELQKEKEWSASLEKQIKDKESQIQAALNKIEEKDRINADTFEKLRDAERRNTTLELDLRQMKTELVMVKQENEDLKQQTAAQPRLCRRNRGNP